MKQQINTSQHKEQHKPQYNNNKQTEAKQNDMPTRN